MATAFDPTQAPPDWQAQRDTLNRMYQQGLINLNAKKGNLFAQEGFQNLGNYSTNGQPIDFSNLQVDPNQEYGGYRNELRSEANMLDQADNGPDRGFTGGVANQASRYAQQAVKGRQTAYQQNLQQTLGGLNQEAGNQSFNYNEGLQGVAADEKQYLGGQTLWQQMNAPIVVPGSSGGGSTPTKPTISPQSMAASYGYQMVKNPTNLHPTTFTQPKAKPPARGGHAL